MLDGYPWEKSVKLFARVMILLAIAVPWAEPADWIAAAAPLWMAIWGGILWRIARREQQNRRRQWVESQNRDMLQTLLHYRHDWMNDLQVLFGYTRLKKFEKLLPYIEKIRDRMATESALSRLGVPSLMSYLVRFRTENPYLDLKVEAYNGNVFSEDPKLAETAATAVIAVLEGLARFATAPAEGMSPLTLAIEETDAGIVLHVEYAGTYRQRELSDLFANAGGQAGSGVVWSGEYREDGAEIKVRIAF